MSPLGIKLGVAFGMVATVASFFPIFMLFMGNCFFEQGCGKHEDLQILGVVLVSCIVGLAVAWTVARVSGIVVSRRHQV
jgi:hypothetical protein